MTIILGGDSLNKTFLYKNKMPDIYIYIFFFLIFKGHCIIGCNIFKARLVTRSFTRTYSIDYQETFAPVAKLCTNWVLLSISTKFHWPLQ